MKRTCASPFSSSVILSVSPSLPIRACWDWTMSGSASSGGTAIVRGASDEPDRERTSSGRQTVTSAQRGHFGLSLSGGGIRLCETVSRSSLTAVRAAVRKRLVQRDAHALAALGVIDGAFLDAVAVLLEQQRLEADLDALRLVDALRDMRALAALVVDRRHNAILRFGDIELGDDAQRRRGKRQRPADNLVARQRFAGLQRLRRRKRRAGPVDAGVNAIALDRVTRLRPLALRPHEIGKPRAIDELVHHPRRNERRIAADRRRGRWNSSWLSVIALAPEIVRLTWVATNSPPPKW